MSEETESLKSDVSGEIWEAAARELGLPLSMLEAVRAQPEAIPMPKPGIARALPPASRARAERRREIEEIGLRAILRRAIGRAAAREDVGINELAAGYRALESKSSPGREPDEESIADEVRNAVRRRRK